MAEAARSKSKEVLIPTSIGAAWRRASKVRFHPGPPADSRALLDSIVGILAPAARGTLMSDPVKKDSLTAPARSGRRKGLKSPGPRQRRRDGRASARPGRRKGLQSLGPRQRRKGVREPARQERRRGKRPG